MTVNRAKSYNNLNAGITGGMTGSKINYSLFYHNVLYGIYVGSSTVYPIYSNCVAAYNNTGIRLLNTGTPGPTFTNCISYGNTIKALNSTGTGASSIINSCINGSATWGVTTSTNNITSNPIFVNPANNDFHLNYDSPCRDTGIPIDGVTNPINDADGVQTAIIGFAPDMGAFEFRKKKRLM
jgi:hypothetical protein